MADGEPVIFESVRSYAAASPGPIDPVRPIALAGRQVVGRQADPATSQPNEPDVRVHAVLALITPADAPGRVRLTVLLGDAPPDGQFTWRLHHSTGAESVEFWRFAGSSMIYGPIEPAEGSAQFGQHRLSARLDPGVSRNGFDRHLAAMIDQLEKLLADAEADAARTGGMAQRERARELADLRSTLEQLRKYEQQ